MLKKTNKDIDEKIKSPWQLIWEVISHPKVLITTLAVVTIFAILVIFVLQLKIAVNPNTNKVIVEKEPLKMKVIATNGNIYLNKFLERKENKK